MIKNKIITLATSKGGAGKTTLVRSIAAHWYQVGIRGAIIDADPQGSIISRHDPDGPLKGLHVIAEPEESVSEVVQDLKKDFSHILIDTGGFRNRTTVKALVVSDFALIPLKPSVDDIAEAVETYSLLKEINQIPERVFRPVKYRMVLTMTQQGTIISKHVRQHIEAMGYLLLKAELYNRVIYPETAIKGLSPSIVEPDGAASRDIASIIREIDFILENLS